MKKPTEKLTLTRTNLYMIIMMLNSIIDEFYDELSHISYKDMYALMDSENAFSFFEKYPNNGAVQTLLYIYDPQKIDEFNYLMADMLCISFPRKASIEFKGVNLLLSACMELYVHYKDYARSYNNEPEPEYSWKDLLHDFSADFKNLGIMIYLTLRNIFRKKKIRIALR